MELVERERELDSMTALLDGLAEGHFPSWQPIEAAESSGSTRAIPLAASKARPAVSTTSMPLVAQVPTCGRSFGPRGGG